MLIEIYNSCYEWTFFYRRKQLLIAIINSLYHSAIFDTIITNFLSMLQ